jgi:hypothetical protein
LANIIGHAKKLPVWREPGQVATYVLIDEERVRDLTQELGGPEFGWAIALSTQVHQMSSTAIVYSHPIGAGIEDGDPPIGESADPGHLAQKVLLVAFHKPDDNLRFT